MGYWAQLAARAFLDAWDAVSGAKVGSVLIGALILLVVYLITRKIRGHESAKDTAIETLILAAATVSVLVVFFLVHFFVIAPPKINAEQTKSVTILLSSNKSLHAALKARPSERQTNEPQPVVAQLTNMFSRSEARMDERFTRQEKLMAEQGRLSSQTLTQMANKTLDTPKIESSSKIDLSTVAKVSSFVVESQAKEAAKAELAKRKAAEEAEALDVSGEQFLAFFTNLVDHHVSAFSNILNQLASEHGDKIKSTYTTAAEYSNRPQGQDSGVLHLRKTRLGSSTFISENATPLATHGTYTDTRHSILPLPSTPQTSRITLLEEDKG